LHELLKFSYDGNSIGTHLGDTSREMSGHIDLFIDFASAAGVFSKHNFNGGIQAVTQGEGYHGIVFSISNVAPVSHEFRPVSMAALICMSY